VFCFSARSAEKQNTLNRKVPLCRRQKATVRQQRDTHRANPKVKKEEEKSAA
jgi:hypothetical protein